MIWVTKRVAVAPFELKLSPNESYGRATSVGTPPGAAEPSQEKPSELQMSTEWEEHLITLRHMLNPKPPTPYKTGGGTPQEQDAHWLRSSPQDGRGDENQERLTLF